MCTGNNGGGAATGGRARTAWSNQTAGQRANISFNAARSGAGSDRNAEAQYGAANPNYNPSTEQLRIRSESLNAPTGRKTKSTVRPDGDGGKRKKTAAV